MSYNKTYYVLFISKLSEVKKGLIQGFCGQGKKNLSQKLQHYVAFHDKKFPDLINVFTSKVCF